MRRGEVWTVSGAKDHADRPRPVVIVQDDRFDATQSITVCPFTLNEAEAPLFRLVMTPSGRNGLRTHSRLMIDKVSTVPKAKLVSQIGRLDDEDMLRLNRALMVFLGLTRSSRAKPA